MEVGHWRFEGVLGGFAAFSAGCCDLAHAFVMMLGGDDGEDIEACLVELLASLLACFGFAEKDRHRVLVLKASDLFIVVDVEAKDGFSRGVGHGSVSCERC